MQGFKPCSTIFLPSTRCNYQERKYIAVVVVKHAPFRRYQNSIHLLPFHAIWYTILSLPSSLVEYNRSCVPMKRLSFFFKETRDEDEKLCAHNSIENPIGKEGKNSNISRFSYSLRALINPLSIRSHAFLCPGKIPKRES